MTLLFGTTQKVQFRSHGKRSLLFPNRHHRDAPNGDGTALPVAADFRLASFLTGQAIGALKPLQHLRYPTPPTPQPDDAQVTMRYWLKGHWPEIVNSPRTEILPEHIRQKVNAILKRAEAHLG